MHWYDGTIAEAVTLSKQKNAIFVVFIEGDNELSAEMTTTIDDTAVVTRLANQDHFLAIKLKSGSANYTHFAQIYQFVPVPSLFFIGRNGTPLEVVCAGVQPNNLATRIDRILEEHLKNKPSATPSTSSENIRQQTASLIHAEGSNPPPRVEKPQPEPMKTEPEKQEPVKPKQVTPEPKQVTPEPKQETPEPAKIDHPKPGLCDFIEFTLSKSTTARLIHAEGSNPPPRVEKPQPEPMKTEPEKQEPVKPKQVTIEPKQVTPEPKQETPKPAKIDHPKPETTEPPSKVQKTRHIEITKSGKQYDVVCDGDVCTRVPKTKPDDPGPSSANVVIHEPNKEEQAQSISVPNVDDKVDKAKELIEARRREKAAKEKELEIQKELERRATGQGVTELKKWQADQELKQIQEERKREKLENNMARQRILDQIAQDRAERKARDQPQIVQPVIVSQPTVSNPPPTSGDGGTRARIQFKLPDGSSHTAHFDAAGTLADVQGYVSHNLQLSSSQFSLWTAFPRRELNEPEATLRNLQLTPSAALLVLPRRQPNTVSSPSTFANIIAFITQLFTSMILAPSQQLLSWVRTQLGAPPTRPRPPSETRDTNTSPPAGGLRRRRGNVHRLGDEKSDDDNNTWNGNSTQQM